MGTGKFILINKKPIEVNNLTVWGQFFMGPERIIAQDHIGNYFISTVFLGLDHNWGDGPPVLFETMIFDHSPGNKKNFGKDLYQERYRTYEEAEIGHKLAIEMVKKGEIKWD